MKIKNVVRRNSGFLVGCVFAGAASFFAADAGMQNKIPMFGSEKETEGETEEKKAQLQEEETEQTVYETDAFTITAGGTIIKGVETEKTQEEETENPQSEGTEIAGEGQDGSLPEETGWESADSENTDYYVDLSSGNEGGGDWDSQANYDNSGADGYWDASDGSYDSSYNDSYDGSYDGSYEGGEDNSWYEGSPVEIIDSGNGDYSYDQGYGDGSYDSGSGDGGNAAGDSQQSTEAWTPDDVIVSGISSRYIDESELYNYTEEQLRLIRNEIFALHGRIFRSQDLIDYFSQKSWYVPQYDPDEFDAHMFDYLNDYEQANLEVILNYEAALGGN